MLDSGDEPTAVAAAGATVRWSLACACGRTTHLPRRMTPAEYWAASCSCRVDGQAATLTATALMRRRARAWIDIAGFNSSQISELGRRFDIERLYVDPEFRRRGLAKLLIAHAIAFCGRSHELTLFLSATDDVYLANYELHAFYGRFGFVSSTSWQFMRRAPRPEPSPRVAALKRRPASKAEAKEKRLQRKGRRAE